MNCTACGGPLKPNPINDSLICEYCKSVYYPDKNADGVVVTGEAKDEPCPVCAIPLAQAVLERLEICYCSRCRGMLILMRSFPELIDALQAKNPGKVDIPAVDPAELQRRLTCPHCHKPMIVDFYPAATNVVMGSCEACALNWIDHGKMARIVDGARVIHQVDDTAAAEKLDFDYPD
jgi:Zn-finger nucleic acid-binding protein